MRMLCLLLLVNAGAMAQTPKPSKNVQLVVLSTTKGDITLYLYEHTPKHRSNFIKLVQEGFFNNCTFHRVIKQFMIQGGDPNSKDNDPNNDGQGGPGYEIDAEITPQYFHKKGALASARNGDDVNPLRRSSGSQFYIVQGKPFTEAELDQQQTRVQNAQMGAFAREYIKRPAYNWLTQEYLQGLYQNNPDSLQRLYARLDKEIKAAYTQDNKLFTFTPPMRQAYTTAGGAPHLDQTYTVFGEVVSGLNVVDAIAESKTDGRDRPIEAVVMQAKILEMPRKAFEKQYPNVLQ